MATIKTKIFNLRLSVDHWRFLKTYSLNKEISMNNIVIDMIDKLKKRHEKKMLTEDNSRLV